MTCKQCSCKQLDVSTEIHKKDFHSILEKSRPVYTINWNKPVIDGKDTLLRLNQCEYTQECVLAKEIDRTWINFVICMGLFVEDRLRLFNSENEDIFPFQIRLHGKSSHSPNTLYVYEPPKNILNKDNFNKELRKFSNEFRQKISNATKKDSHNLYDIRITLQIIEYLYEPVEEMVKLL